MDLGPIEYILCIDIAKLLFPKRIHTRSQEMHAGSQENTRLTVATLVSKTEYYHKGT